ncbi:hypothetical protein GOBAR_AA11418 [Gossypium barbadense]|uniref:RRM domain-containing protein n=1 Tax=Gossypium barbadense TaxID=3634 RepID=A0A2P5Y0V6_GOSBA|nr:hypothetical protein GOBAR_AA11418 [Gossypium barbadense]
MEFTNPKLVINGISTEMNEMILRRHFSAYGKVKHVVVYAKKSIAFITFVDPSKAQISLQQQHIILGRKVEVRPAKPKVEIGKRKIFVGGLPRSITDEEFKGYFEKFGSIVDAVVIHDKETKRSRGFGFVTYEAEESANLVLRTNFHLLNNKRVEVKKVTPRKEMDKAKVGIILQNNPYFQETPWHRRQSWVRRVIDGVIGSNPPARLTRHLCISSLQQHIGGPRNVGILVMGALPKVY